MAAQPRVRFAYPGYKSWEAIGSRLLRAYEPLLNGTVRPVHAAPVNFGAIEA